MGNLGVIYSRSGRTREAIEAYRRALKIAPNDTALLVNCGLAYLKEDNHAAAKRIFAPLAAQHPSDARLRELLATTQVFTGESDKALASLEQLPRTPNTIYLMGLANLRLGRRERARQLLDESFPAAMRPAQAAFLRGKAYYDATLFEDAIREYRKARELDANLPGVRMELARALVSIRDNDASEKELREILASQPSDADACYLLGALLVQEGKEMDAISFLEKARAARPDGWGAYYYLGRARLQANDARAAVPLLQKAANLNPDESAVFYHLSRALKALGRDAEARKASARVAELKRQGVQRDQEAVFLR
jgi:Flp pilus assembly protein TadD